MCYHRLHAKTFPQYFLFLKKSNFFRIRSHTFGAVVAAAVLAGLSRRRAVVVGTGTVV